MLRIADTTVSYNRTQIVKAALPWRWRGVLHEFLTCEEARSSGILEGLRLRRHHDGARRRDPQTYRRDAEILEAALQTESDPFMRSRYQFYLAQSYRDCGEKEKALQAYGLIELDQFGGHLATPLTHSGNIFTDNYAANVALQPDTSTGLTFAGSAGHDELHGGTGNDALSGAGGDDTIDGGSGRDTATFSGLHSAYDVSGLTVSGGVVSGTMVGPDGTDTLCRPWCPQASPAPPSSR
jgi:hypothetical protein